MTLTPFNCPLSEERAKALYSSLQVSPGSLVLDAGCGRGEFLINLSRATGCCGRGVDIDEAALVDGRHRASELRQADKIEFKVHSLRTPNLHDNQFDASICLGSSHAFADGEDAYPSTLKHLSKYTRPNGIILVGECFWMKPPAPEYLKFLGDPVGIYRTFEENIECAESIGLRLVENDAATRQEWDKFETDHLRRAEAEARNHPNDESVAAKLSATREWYLAYEQWGCTTLGFGYYLFQNRP